MDFHFLGTLNCCIFHTLKNFFSIKTFLKILNYYKNLELQLKSEHKPLQHLADWKRCIVSQLTNVDPLKEEPNLMFMRDAKCILKNEKKICEKVVFNVLDLKINFKDIFFNLIDKDL